MGRSAATMRDVALKAGVSIQTVSCVVNGTGNISDETRYRVHQAIEALHYKRNPIARSMRTRQTRLIALLVADITNPVLSIIASAIEAAAFDQDYNVLLYNAGKNSSREALYLDQIEDRRADGIVVINALDRARTLPRLADYIPAVIIDVIQNEAVPSVSVDNQKGAYLATNHLIDLGHRRIALIGVAPSTEVTRQRLAGYLEATGDAKLSYQKWRISDSVDWTYGEGYKAMRWFLELKQPDRPTAVFAASDQLAMGAFRAIEEAGLRIPHDISVVGFDNIEAASYTTPPLTTVHQPFEELGTRALDQLLTLLEGKPLDQAQVLLPPNLIIRESTMEAQ